MSGSLLSLLVFMEKFNPTRKQKMGVLSNRKANEKAHGAIITTSLQKICRVKLKLSEDLGRTYFAFSPNLPNFVHWAVLVQKISGDQ